MLSTFLYTESISNKIIWALFLVAVAAICMLIFGKSDSNLLFYSLNFLELLYTLAGLYKVLKYLILIKSFMLKLS